MMDALSQIWTWLLDEQNRGAVTLILAGITAVGAAAWKIYEKFSKSPPGPSVSASGGAMAAGGDISATAQPGGTAIIATGPVTVNDVDKIVKGLEAAHERELAGYQDREQQLQDRNKSLTEAVTALIKQKEQPDAPPGIDDALAHLAQGNTAGAEAVFQEVLNRKAAEGAASNKEAAAAARHLGALAYLHDTQKALNAYRRAVELDPNEADGWNQLGRLLLRVGELGEAEAAYQSALSIGETTRDPATIAVAYGNLGIIYKTRGDLDQAEAMHRKALALNEELGRKQGMASNYGNLGIVYKTRGDLEEAEAMYRKALALNEELGRKEGIANQYGNLGIVYQTRGDLKQAEAMYRKSLAIEEELGRKGGMASDYGNLGIVYKTRGDLKQVEAMYRKSLAIEEELGRKEGMASDYGNLGIVYQTRGDLKQAEAMYRKSLAIEEELGRKEGMASDYGNLGTVYQTRGDLKQAEAMYRKSLALFKEVGVIPQVKKVQGWLDALRPKP